MLVENYQSPGGKGANYRKTKDGAGMTGYRKLRKSLHAWYRRGPMKYPNGIIDHDLKLP